MLAAQTADVKSLEHSKWKLVDLGPVKVPRTPPFTMTLEKESFLLSGCNSVSGKLRLGPSRILFVGPARSTRKACLGGLDDADSAFAKLVGASLNVRLDRDRMTLTSDANTIAGFFILDCITSVLLVTLSGFYPSPP
jgi:heat shock protein HslJ